LRLYSYSLVDPVGGGMEIVNDGMVGWSDGERDGEWKAVPLSNITVEFGNTAVTKGITAVRV
jgi:hypothetical protein